MVKPLASPPPKLLVVEGQDDLHVVRHLRMRHASTPCFCIQDKGNVDKVLDSIGPEIRAENRRALGILVDANDDLTGRWQAVTGRIHRVGIQPPKSPNSAGTIINTAGNPRIGIWMMPDNTSTGELEDFVAKMIPNGDPVWPRSRCYIDGIPITDRKFKSKKTLKAKVHAWLATREDPRRMGAAIGAKDLDVNGPLCQKFVDWLTRLFQ